jgi:hypothetical protein
MEENSTIVVELILFASNMNFFGDVLKSFLLVIRKYEKHKTYNILFLMLNLRFDKLRSIFSLMGWEEGVVIIEKYDKRFLLLIFLKRHHFLISFNKNWIFVKLSNECCNLDIFEMTTRTIKPTKELVNMKFQNFQHYQLDVKDIKCCLQWWKKHELVLDIVVLLTWQILGIVKSQIKTKKVSSLAKIQTWSVLYCSWKF